MLGGWLASKDGGVVAGWLQELSAVCCVVHTVCAPTLGHSWRTLCLFAFFARAP